jgi:hypothetical protein
MDFGIGGNVLVPYQELDLYINKREPFKNRHVTSLL